MHPKYQKQFTSLAIEPNPNIVLNETIGFIGSCFAQNIGKKLSELSYPSFQSPFGVVFNPVSIAKVLQSLDTSEEPWEQTNEGYFSLNHHHLLKNKNLKSLQNDVTKLKSEFKNNLQNTNHVFISLGSAWVYRHLEKDVIVANCHKIPQQAFKKQMLSEIEVLQSLKEIKDELQKLNSKISIYFTISPVKHLRDGIIENSQSKSRLVSALHTFLLDNSDCFYFPSLEIVQEELRDYRYYANDLAHPSEWTINYIFERWLETYFDDQNQKQMELLKKEFSSKNHRLMS